MRRSTPARAVRPVLAAAALSLSAALVGCGGVGYADATTAELPEPSAGTTSGSPQPEAVGPALAVREADGVGEVAVDAAGFTLYRFDSDTADPPTSACSGDCAEVWPPATVEDASGLAAEGIDPDLLGTLTRGDGSLQVTLAGWPLYRYAEDGAPGDALGHGVGGTWFAATATGERAAAPGPEEPAAETSDGDWYDY
ncbi:MAG: hypothetical protein ACFCVF_06220 [Kineosporiaceae bacterium]